MYSIKAVNEPLVIGGINIKGVEKRDTYEEYIAKVEELVAKDTANEKIKRRIQRCIVLVLI